MAICGSGVSHCCYFKGVPCQYVAPDDMDGRKWQCTLRSELGDWASVHTDARYVDNVIPLLAISGIEGNCGDWPPQGTTCSDCGLVGS